MIKIYFTNYKYIKIMNYGILNQYNIKFVNVDGKKRVSFKGRSIIERYIYIYNDVESVDELLADADLAIQGNLDQIENYIPNSNPPSADYTAGDGGCDIWGNLTSNHLKLIETEVINDSIIIPIADWNEILLSWKEFLQS